LRSSSKLDSRTSRKNFQNSSASAEATPQYESILDVAQITKLEKIEWFQKNPENVPLFLPPAAFSRMDGPQVTTTFPKCIILKATMLS
jgi:hypothetical protein